MSFIDKAKDVADDVKDKTVDLVDKIGEKIPDSVKDTAGDFKDKAGELVDKVKERLGLRRREERRRGRGCGRR